MSRNYFSTDIWSDSKISQKVVKNIKIKSKKFYSIYKRLPYIMEVCGTHTVSIARSGIRNLIGDCINLISGPGCPVCVTSQGDIDRVLKFSEHKNVIIATFGDMVKVKGSQGYDLNSLRIKGIDVRIVYSPMDCIDIALSNPDKDLIFIGVGFETTAPSVAATVKFARKNKIKNFLVAPLFKLVPPALKFLLDTKISKIDAFILPGHVSVIIGSNAYEFLWKDYKIVSVISGFEPLDILVSIDMILKHLLEKDKFFDVEYVRAVKEEGNRVAIDIMNEVFKTCDSYWRAVGVIKDSGYKFSQDYLDFDAFERYNIEYVESMEPCGCLCGKILLGLKRPIDCPLFGKKCTPTDAVGPCMVSSEGACASWYKYGIRK
jgi:hydrogenase expression/formation protein HypD